MKRDNKHLKKACIESKKWLNKKAPVKLSHKLTEIDIKLKMEEIQ